MTKRKPLEWYDTELGPMPGCTTCAERLMDPLFVEAVYSCSIEHARSDPAGLARRTINHFHANRHREDL